MTHPSQDLRRFVGFFGVVPTMLLFAGAIGGCESGGRVVVEGDGGTVVVDVPRDREERGGRRRDGDYRYESRLPDIPPGHLPPPGKCRIWYPGRPPGRQPPPKPCHELEGRVPEGAWLIHGDRASRGRGKR